MVNGQTCVVLRRSFLAGVKSPLASNSPDAKDEALKRRRTQTARADARQNGGSGAWQAWGYETGRLSWNGPAGGGGGRGVLKGKTASGVVLSRLAPNRRRLAVKRRQLAGKLTVHKVRREGDQDPSQTKTNNTQPPKFRGGHCLITPPPLLPYSPNPRRSENLLVRSGGGGRERKRYW